MTDHGRNVFGKMQNVLQGVTLGENVRCLNGLQEERISQISHHFTRITIIAQGNYFAKLENLFSNTAYLSKSILLCGM